MDVLNRTTKQYLKSVNTPEYPVQDWIHAPDLTSVTGFASKYWVITGDNVTLADQSARDAIDAAEQSTAKDAQSDEMDSGYLKGFALVVLDEINNLRAEHGQPDRTISQLKTAVRSKL